MQLQVVTPFGEKVKQDGVDEVVAPGELGELGIRPGHLPLITALGVGRFVVVEGGKNRPFLVDGGYLEIADERVLVVTERCESPEDIDVEAAKKELAEAEAALKDVENQSDAKRAPWDHQIKRALTRLEVASATN